MSARLDQLPEEILLRMLSLSGEVSDQMRLAYLLGSVCRRLRTVLITSFLPTISKLDQDHLSALALNDPRRAQVALCAMLERATAIRAVFLSGCSPTLFTPTCFETLARSSAAALRTVNLDYNNRLADDCVRPLLLRCPKLTELSLLSCSAITGEMFQDPNMKAPLKLLNLSYAHSLTYDSILSLANISTITELKLTGCDRVSAKAVEALANGPISRSLTSISLNFCPVPDQALAMLIENAPHLTRITLAEHTGNLWGTGQYTPAFIDSLNSRYRGVDIVVEN